MKKIDRLTEPDFWTEYKRRHPTECYADLKKTAEGNELRRRLRMYLIRSQCGLCAYCCRKIGPDDSLNEHIKPQNAYLAESMAYDNLVASCKTEGKNATCGAAKDKHYDGTLFVSPLEADCEKEFLFYPNGEIEGIGERGKYTCGLLNLNAYELQMARRAQYKICEGYHNGDMVRTYFLTPDADGQLEAFADMIQYFYERGEFDIEDGTETVQ